MNKLKGLNFNKEGGDLQSTVTNNKFLNRFSTGCHPGEFHLKSLNPLNKTNATHFYTAQIWA